MTQPKFLRFKTVFIRSTTGTLCESHTFAWRFLTISFGILTRILKLFTCFHLYSIMLHICTNITEFSTFFEFFRKTQETKRCIDLSNVFSWDLANECDSILHHHKDCIVFLGHLEPGFMLDAPSQTRLRKLFRKFDVGLVTHYPASLPFSWKNEIHTIYTTSSTNNHGDASVIHNGRALQHESSL